MKNLAKIYGILALVFDIIGIIPIVLLFGWFLLYAFFLTPIPITAIIFGRLGIKRDKTSGMANPGMVLVIIVLIIYLVVGIISLITVFPFLNGW